MQYAAVFSDPPPLRALLMTAVRDNPILNGPIIALP